MTTNGGVYKKGSLAALRAERTNQKPQESSKESIISDNNSNEDVDTHSLSSSITNSDTDNKNDNNINNNNNNNKATKHHRSKKYIDEYGFVIDEDEAKKKWQEIDTDTHRKSVRKQNERIYKWLHMIDNWNTYNYTKKSKLKSRIRKGIPAPLRSKVWKKMLGVSELTKDQRLYYSKIRYQTPTERFKTAIDNDLNRTFPRHTLFTKNRGKESLRNVLYAFATYDVDVGYTQGMGFIAALFLMLMPEDDAFWCLCKLLDENGSFKMRGLYIDGLPLLHLRYYQFSQCLLKCIPKVYQHINSFNIPPALYASKWFMTTFCCEFPFDFVHRIWDIYLNEGVKCIFYISLGLMKINESRILKIKRFDEMMQFLQEIHKYAQNIDTLLTKAFDLPLKHEHLQEIEETYYNRKLHEERSRASTRTRKGRSRAVNDMGNKIGLTVGGAKDVNNFRKCIDKNIMPSNGSITYHGLLYEYYFDTTMTAHNIETEEKEEINEMLFYPTYCYAKVKKMDFTEKYNDNNDHHLFESQTEETKTESMDINGDIHNRSQETVNTDIVLHESDEVLMNRNGDNAEYEYYMSVGLNSNINQDDFKRKHLNLIILLDKSGSMQNSFGSKCKMAVASESVAVLLKHLTPNDRFGLVTFESKAYIEQELMNVDMIDMSKLGEKILAISSGGGTNFECGYNKAIDLFNKLIVSDEQYNDINNEYENRIIILTDAQPNEGECDSNILLNLVSLYAQQGINKNNINHLIYTTFIGIGLDFNTNLVDKICTTRGCNYYSVKSIEDFMNKMDDEFEYMVTPLVFNVCLKLKSQNNSCKIDKIYGSNNCESDEIIKINTLFPAKPSSDSNGRAGGIQLIKLKTLKNDNINIDIIVQFEDRNCNKFTNKQHIKFKLPELSDNNDMIEYDEKENKEMNFYDNIGIRKAILLCRYTEIMINWIESENDNEKNKKLRVNKKYVNIFYNFLEYFRKEMKLCDDETLDKEIKIMQKLQML